MGSTTLRGYLCHELRYPASTDFHIHRLAVVPGQRGRGCGQWLMWWVLAKAAALPQSKCQWVTLSALDSAATFYEQFGFMDMGCGDPGAEADQTWMELKNVSLVAEKDQEEEEEGDTDLGEEEGDAVSRDGESDLAFLEE